MITSKLIHLTGAITSMALLYGCTTAKSVPSIEYQPRATAKMELNITKPANVAIPSDQYTYLVGKMDKELRERGLLASDKSHPELMVDIKLKSYRIRDDDTRRTAVGIFEGCDYIDSEVTVIRSETTDILGKSDISIRECFPEGIVTSFIDIYIEGVVAFLTEKKETGDVDSYDAIQSENH